MFIVYEGIDEVLITIPENEKKFVKEWITDAQREIDDYDRLEVEKGFMVSARMKVGL